MILDGKILVTNHFLNSVTALKPCRIEFTIMVASISFQIGSDSIKGCISFNTIPNGV